MATYYASLSLELFTGAVAFLKAEAEAEAEAEARSPTVIMQYNETKADLGVSEIHSHEN
ncbi:uncharacterized protein H6S33_004467 [Morchella sextelata]|uniref:uncharacterized protein n=1 Tax=Morchella sextelata TaxID=1174677 RepID=UPI001D037916|nr:uncharacterized protein H6S33_004467 [Morchella sextelata]KAH0606010.1 hypothetical protein H6S33_004467 [Morchella sextelata]